MLILWLRRNKNSKRNQRPKNTKESFRKHDEDMKKFCFSHPILETTGPKEIITLDRNLLVTVQNVKLARHTQN